MSQVFEGDPFHAHPVDQDFTVGRIVKSTDQVNDGGLTASGVAHHGQRSTCGNVETHVVESRDPRIRVGEGDVLESDASLNGLAGCCSTNVIILDGRFSIQELVDADHARRCLLDERCDPTHGSERPREHVHVDDELGDVAYADRGVTIDELDAADQDGEHGAQADQQHDRWHEERIHFRL